jgi:hypothetical protein
MQMEYKSITAETDYRFQKYKAQKHKDNHFVETETNICSNSLYLLISRSEYLSQKLKKANRI